MKNNKPTYLTAAQMAALAPYEENMRTAVKSDYTRGLGANGARLMGRILSEVTGGPSYVNLSCPVCVLNTARRVGKLYFDTLDRNAAEETARRIEDNIPEPVKVAIAKPSEAEAEAMRQATADQFEELKQANRALAKAVKEKAQETPKSPAGATNGKKTSNRPAAKRKARKTEE